MNPSEIKARLQKVQLRIETACLKTGRDPSEVKLLAVSKMQPIESILAAYEAGQRDFGENYVQELAQKAQAVEKITDIRWHLIGPLQTNKAKQAALIANGIQSVSSVRMVEALARHIPKEKKLHLHIQVNVSGEAQKSGCSEIELTHIIHQIYQFDCFILEGLMTVPPADDIKETQKAFQRLKELAHQFKLNELSMGMSDDLEVAIAEGSTCVRVGQSIFGQRA